MSKETAFSTSGDEVETALPVTERNAAPHLAALGRKARDYARNARSENTQRAYDADWRQFSCWLRRQGFDALPPNPQTVGLYLAACVDGGRGRSHFRRDAGAAPLGDLLALSPARRTAGHERSTHLDRARRHSTRPCPTAGPERSDLRRRAARDAGDVDNDLKGPRDKAISAIGFRGGQPMLGPSDLDCGPNQSQDGTGWIEIFARAHTVDRQHERPRQAARKEKDDECTRFSAARQAKADCC